MAVLLLGCVLAIGIIAVVLGRPWLRARRRSRLQHAAFPPAWRRVLERDPNYIRMPEPLRERWEHSIRVFLDEKRFIACGGLVLDDSIRVSIAAQATLLIFNRADDCYPGLRYVLVYPRAFRVPGEDWDEAGVITEEERVLAGESWDQGRVIISWEDAQRAHAPHNEAENVVLHEFAHQLDQASGSVDGAPPLGEKRAHDSWARVMQEEFRSLRERAERGDPGVIDEYGASDPGEFFAVVTEAFLQRPRAMQREHSELYALLEAFYRLDPASWAPVGRKQHCAAGSARSPHDT